MFGIEQWEQKSLSVLQYDLGIYETTSLKLN